jgi:hypothetical protein
MKAIRYGISGLLVAGFAFVAACGGSTDDGDGTPGTGGKSSTGGRSGAGTGSTSAGSTGFPNNPACPASAPANATACTITGQQTTCEYSGLSCRCARTGGGGGMFPGGTAGGASTATREWQCTAMLVCPATKPTTGDACTPASGNCRYSGMGSCSCSAQTSKWACTGGGGPGGGTGGSFSGFGGGFSFGGFNFGNSGGTPSTGNPGGGTCPATKPAADSACTGDLSCPYTGGGCVCSASKWTCL